MYDNNVKRNRYIIKITLKYIIIIGTLLNNCKIYLF